MSAYKNIKPLVRDIREALENIRLFIRYETPKKAWAYILTKQEMLEQYEDHPEITQATKENKRWENADHTSSVSPMDWRDILEFAGGFSSSRKALPAVNAVNDIQKAANHLTAWAFLGQTVLSVKDSREKPYTPCETIGPETILLSHRPLPEYVSAYPDAAEMLEGCLKQLKECLPNKNTGNSRLEPYSHEWAEHVATDFLDTTNPDRWDGTGEKPENFSDIGKTYALPGNKKLLLILETDPDSETPVWTHLCQVYDSRRVRFTASLHGYGIDSPGNLADTILDACREGCGIPETDQAETVMKDAMEHAIQMGRRLEPHNLRITPKGKTSSDGRIRISLQVHTKYGESLENISTGWHKDLESLIQDINELENYIKNTYYPRKFRVSVVFTETRNYNVEAPTEEFAREYIQNTRSVKNRIKQDHVSCEIHVEERKE